MSHTRVETPFPCTGFSPLQLHMLLRSLAFLLFLVPLAAQPAIVLKAARVFDGETMHPNWSVRIRANRIESAGPSVDTAGAKLIDLGDVTLMPGLVEGHSHVLLHAYNEVPWNDQVARQGIALRTARAEGVDVAAVGVVRAIGRGRRSGRLGHRTGTSEGFERPSRAAGAKP